MPQVEETDLAVLTMHQNKSIEDGMSFIFFRLKYSDDLSTEK